MLTALQVLDTVDLLDGCWADRHGCRQAGGMLATSASLLDTSSTCLDTSCLDDLMDAVQEDGLFGGGLSAAGGPNGEPCSAVAACLVSGTAACWQPGAHDSNVSECTVQGLVQPAWAMLLTHVTSSALHRMLSLLQCGSLQRPSSLLKSVIQQAPRPTYAVLSCSA